MKALKQADYLSPKYHVVIANPPYMGGKGMNNRLRTFAQDNYPDSKSDCFAMFIERGFNLTLITDTTQWLQCKAGCSYHHTKS